MEKTGQQAEGGWQDGQRLQGVSAYGIHLQRLASDGIELLRQWRNDERIRGAMDFREHITIEAQRQWFEGLCPATDFYFLILDEGQPHGLIHLSSIAWAERTGQAGLFIHTERFMGTQLPAQASAAMLECFFRCSPLEAVEAKVMRGNNLALSYNLSLGFEETASEQPDRFHRLRLSKERFYTAFDRQLRTLRRIHAARMEMMVGGERRDIDLQSRVPIRAMP